ncbi:hypothetical protein HY090_01500 [Candidatus Kaiserbacteria bacterium]|nr:hypothetical protein [Candidatus Kaiserbacteria bacterium]
MWTKPFSQISKNDAAIAGGKGASLGEMTQAGIPVPPGFVLLSFAFDHFVEETGLAAQIDAILKTVAMEKMDTVESASAQAQALILGKEIPGDMVREVEEEFKKLGTTFVAVRSSATAEDSASAAWAGQLDTYLNTTETTLVENVCRCWASLFTPRAVFYRFEKGLQGEKVSVAVVVQKMINSEAAGIAFSVHPVTEDRNQMIIEGAFGLGEAVVSGQITPDSYVLTKEPLQIVEKNIVEQDRALYRKEGGLPGQGGNEWVDLSPEKGLAQEISDAQVLELAALVLKIEAHYGFPVDVEWATEGGKFYITQSRPITTLSTKSLIQDDEVTQPQKHRKIDLIFTRDFDQWVEEICRNCLVRDCPKIWGRGLSDQIVRFDGRTFEWYRYHDDMVELKEFLTSKPSSDFIFQESTQDKFLSLVQEIRGLISINFRTLTEPQLHLQKITELFSAMYVYYPLGIFIAGPWRADFLAFHQGEGEKVLELLMKSRHASEGLLKQVGNYIRDWMEDILTKNGYRKEYARLLSVDEVKKAIEHHELPSLDVLAERSRGYVYINGQIENSTDFEKFLSGHELFLEKEEDGEKNILRGTVAYSSSSRLQGMVKLVFNSYDIKSFEEGFVLVTPMTAPDFLGAMQKSLAIITDEGGVTCHAAITARELKKPCIIGTKNATKVLKDGDMVEVDAEKGIVRILGR